MNTEPLNKILGAAIELFRQYGFKTITMDDIARRAGISKKTLYQHFANKNEVVSEAIGNYKDHMSAQCCTMMDEAENAVEAMVRIMEMFDQINRQTNPLAMLELERFYPDAYKKFRDSMIERDVAHIKENIEWGMKDGLYREEIDAEFMARYRMELSLLTYHSTILTGEKFSLQFIGRQMNEHFLHGIMTIKGEKLFKKYKEQYITQVSKI